MVSRGHSPEAVRSCRDRQRERQGGNEVPDRELAVLHLRSAGNDRWSEEHGQAPPFRIGLLALVHQLLTAALPLAGPSQNLNAPAVADVITDQSTDFARNRLEDHDGDEVQLA